MSPLMTQTQNKIIYLISRKITSFSISRLTRTKLMIQIRIAITQKKSKSQLRTETKRSSKLQHLKKFVLKVLRNYMRAKPTPEMMAEYMQRNSN